MTSMPASRSARAMIFAPRSCPSRPGFATTTRIFPATARSLAPKTTSGTWFRTCLVEPGPRRTFYRVAKRRGGAAGLRNHGPAVNERKVSRHADRRPIAAPPPLLWTPANTLDYGVEHHVRIDAEQIDGIVDATAS